MGQTSGNVPKDFNSRPSARGDPTEITRRRKSTLFQFTPLREGRRITRHGYTAVFNFNSRPSARGDSPPADFFVGQKYFNSRPSARGDAPVPIRAAGCLLFQFTPLREGRLVPSFAVNCHKFQFTPLREGRRLQILSTRKMAYFNSRPSARGDGMLRTIFASTSAFQFTPLREGRPASKSYVRCCDNISIHAPPRGATVL